MGQCYVVESQFTTYTTSDADEDETRDSALNAIKSAALNGDFNNEDVLGIIILDETNAVNNNNNDFGTRGTGEGGGGNNVAVYIGIAASVLIVVVGAIVYRRRGNRSSNAELEANDASAMTPTITP